MNNKDKKLYRKLKGLLMNLVSFSYLTKESKKTKRIKSLQRYFKLTEKDLSNLWYNTRFRTKKDYSSMPRMIFRDNKDSYNTNSKCYYSNRNKIRYPSKKRSKKVWANFYKLFPRLAIEEKWDGHTSTRYN